MTELPAEKQQKLLIRALTRLLKPLVRLMIRKHITFPVLRDLLKKIYVQQASELIEQDGEATSYSRVFILTGIHRKDIKRLSNAAEAEVLPAHNRSLGGQLIANWLALPEFQDQQGRPRSLPFNGDQKTPGFEQLVSAASKDIRPRAMLDEWLRQGIVISEGDNIILNEKAFVPAKDFDQLCDYFGSHVHDHLAAISHNLLDEGEPMFERSVYYGNLTSESIDQLRHQASILGDELLQNLNQHAMQLYRQDKEDPQAIHRFRMGCYWFDEEKW